jgi:diguanylate cyclase (GGDEF)-like protein
MLGLGALGWGVLIAAGSASVGSTAVGVTQFMLFLVVLVVARSMAFALFPHTIISLDSAFYVAAAVGLGALTAGRLVAIALTLDALLRLIHSARYPRSGHPQRVESLSYVVYFGGMSGALLFGCGWLFGVDRLEPAIAAELNVLATVFAVGATFLVAHYAIQGLRRRLRGEPFAFYLRRIAVPGMLAEASLLPLAVVLVFIYSPDRPLAFALLGATYLLINFVFNRLSNATLQLSRRVVELETLNITAHRLAASLQLYELIDAVARETVKALPAAEGLTLGHLEMGNDELLIMDRYDCETSSFDRERVAVAGSSALARVMGENRSFLIGAEGESGGDIDSFDGSSPAIPRSWMAVPIVIYDNVEGVLAVHSDERSAFGDDELRLLESIGAQVAVALQNSQLYELAMVDGLTGLFVRRYFEARLDEEVQRSDRFGSEFSVIMMDLDHFKDLNDTHGHPAGDRILRDIAEIVRSEMRGVDTAARYGGEEFSMILPRTQMVAAYNLAKRIRARIAEHEVEIDGAKVGLTASFGIASYPESEARDASELVRLADRALYRAKQLGRNRVELYWSDSNDSGRPSIRSL